MAFSFAEGLHPLVLHHVVFLFIAFLWSSTRVTAQHDRDTRFDLDPINNFCERWYVQSVVENDMLFIEGGLQKYGTVLDEVNPVMGNNNWLISVPVSATWDWKETNGTRQFNISGIPMNQTNPSTGTDPPSLMRGHMYHGPADINVIYSFGGTTYMGNKSFEGFVWPDASTYSLSTYDYTIPDAPWQQYDISQPWRANHGAATEAIDQSLGFYLNGQIDRGSSTVVMDLPDIDDAQNLYRPLDGMVIVNFTNCSSNNISTSKLRSDQARVGGSMEYLPNIGASGLLVALGGQVNNESSVSSWVNTMDGDLLDFETIDVWDIDSYLTTPSSNGTWYQQKTIGDIPEPRIDFCSIVVSAQDNSSHHIYIYGGVDLRINNSAGFDDVYALSIPSFTWTSVFSGYTPRWGHNCHLVGKRQMVTVGGNQNTASCDWERRGVAILDISTMTWGSVFNKNANVYQVPNALFSATGGNKDGNAKVLAPIHGWTDPGLKTVFATPRKGTATTPPPESGSMSEPTKRKSIRAPVAVGIAGGVFALAVIAGVFFFLRRKRNKNKAPKKLHGDVIKRSGELGEEKSYELPAVHDEPAELPGPEAVELNAPREFVEADSNNTATQAAELSGTSIVPGGTAGIPQLRTPGDDLPRSPFYVPGPKRRESRGSTPLR
ncbi:hypothetical protein K504DRAFT_505045 [Pleomassaria siparia CBS 279.74]|uniref:Galactose oxidase n=1 Tax=Pleomassaria siparia CBS 279.74 TaxID=1314801 RepID=A0A6G1K270_9PLEO|nr:hypothetical protein K504DRAFT_505045 [Pleomassaria siparia CBS 279.74]